MRSLIVIALSSVLLLGASDCSFSGSSDKPTYGSVDVYNCTQIKMIYVWKKKTGGAWVEVGSIGATDSDECPVEDQSPVTVSLDDGEYSIVTIYPNFESTGCGDSQPLENDPDCAELTKTVVGEEGSSDSMPWNITIPGY